MFENLVDEAVCDGARERSFFYVGDVKQSIYSWRGGDFRLFGEIFSRYSRMGLMEEGEKLVKSWRSGPNVVSLVNAFFSDADALAGAFTRRSADAFSEMFDLHESALPNRPSYVSLSLTERAEGRGRGDLLAEKTAVWEEVYRILRRTDPPGRGKSCAVLLRKNDDVSELVDYVRRRASEDSVRMPIAGELDMRICSRQHGSPAVRANREAPRAPVRHRVGGDARYDACAGVLPRLRRGFLRRRARGDSVRGVFGAV